MLRACMPGRQLVSPHDARMTRVSRVVQWTYSLLVELRLWRRERTMWIWLQSAQWCTGRTDVFGMFS